MVQGKYVNILGPALDYYAILLKMNWYHLYHEVLQYSKNIGVPRSRIMKIVLKKALPFINQKSLLKDQYQFQYLLIRTSKENKCLR